MTSSNQFQKIKNSDAYESEKKRINNYLKNKYASDPEYRDKIRQQQKQYYNQKKLLSSKD